MATIRVSGRPKSPPSEGGDYFIINCWKCHKEFKAPASYNLASYGWVDCPHCKTTNEVGD